jgi:hypothetical protein
MSGLDRYRPHVSVQAKPKKTWQATTKFNRGTANSQPKTNSRQQIHDDQGSLGGLCSAQK